MTAAVEMLVGDCLAEGCGATIESPDPYGAVQAWLVWHVYDDHRDLWVAVTGEDRPPHGPRPDLSRVFVPEPEPLRCDIKGPYYPVGDVDFECRTHGVTAVLRDSAQSRYGAGDLRLDEMRCPVGEPEETAS